MMILRQELKIETVFFAFLYKLIVLIACCLFGVEVSGKYIKNFHTEESIAVSVISAKESTIVNITECDNYDIINLNAKTESNDVSSKQSVEKTKQATPKVSQKAVAKKIYITITNKKNSSKDQYENYLKFIKNSIVSICHQCDDNNAILTSVFSPFFSACSENKIIDTLVFRNIFYYSVSFFARPPPY